MKLLFFVALLTGCERINFDDARQPLAVADPCDGIASAGPAGVQDASQCVLGSLGVTGDATIHGVIDAGGATLHGDLNLDGGSITGAAPVVVSLPIFGPTHDAVLPNQFLNTTGGFGPQGIVVQVSGVPVGATVINLKARIQDTTKTLCVLAASDQRDKDGVLISPNGVPSAGTGSPQTLSMSVPFQVVSLHNYYLGVFPTNTIDQCLVFSVEATYVR